MKQGDKKKEGKQSQLIPISIDLVTQKSKLQTLLNIMEQKEKEYVTNTKLLKDQFTSREADYKTQIRNLKSAQQIEVDHLQTMTRQLEAKILAQEQNWVAMEADYKKREDTSHDFVLSLQKEIHNIRQVSCFFFSLFLGLFAFCFLFNSISFSLFFL